MRNRLVLPLCLVLGAAAVAAKPLSDIPVLLWFGNAAGDGITSDGQVVSVNGLVADYADGMQNVLTIMQSTGNFRFTTTDNTRKAAQRAACVDFGTQFAGPLPYGDGGARQCVSILEAMHNYPTGDIALQNLRYGQSVQKLVRFTWIDGGYAYRLGYGSDMDGDGVMDSPPVSVTCIAPQDASQPCSKWLLAPSDAAGTAAFFRFQQLRKGEGPAEFLGTYDMPFSETWVQK